MADLTLKPASLETATARGIDGEYLCRFKVGVWNIVWWSDFQRGFTSATEGRVNATEIEQLYELPGRERIHDATTSDADPAVLDAVRDDRP